MVTNYSLVIDFVAYRHSVKPLDGIIIFRTNKFSGDGIERELQQRLQLPQVIVKNIATPNLQNFMNVRSIALVLMEKLDKPRTWEIISQSLHRHPFIPMVFVSQAVPPTHNDIMMVRTDKAYPKLQINAVDPRNFSGFVWPKYQNVFGYNFRLSLFEDAPIAYKEVTNNRTVLRGLTGQLLPIFMKRINGTFTVFSYPMNETMKQSIDMTANLVLRTDLIHRSMEASYPVFLTKVCLMLPVESNIPLSWYLLYNFDICTWKMLGFTFFIFVLFVVVIFRNCNCTRDIVLDVLFVLKLFLAQPVLLPGIRSMSRGLFLFYFSGLFVVIVSVYEGSLTSLFSTRIRMPAVHTPDDFLKTDLLIMATEIERKLYFDTKLLPVELVPRLYDMGNALAAIDRTNSNISSAYIMTTDKWLWYEKRQKHLQHPVFRITNEKLCTPSMLQFFALQNQSPFKGILKILFLELQEFGFIEHWLAQVPPAGRLQLSNETGLSDRR
ncbi:uncharacterized protein LOC105210769 [Zeugodacus cucurbitae]|uniref:uncharacterized protein LOC105210769 n=1 Tax=Zeugodacus cucurbitae TaxID=28588 RepID=UPI0023D949EF|nr:uncharacterized protein LOC105210769 [Zeugodacus cucurbitae]